MQDNDFRREQAKGVGIRNAAAGDEHLQVMRLQARFWYFYDGCQLRYRVCVNLERAFEEGSVERPGTLVREQHDA